MNNGQKLVVMVVIISTDKFICSDSGFYDLLDRGDEIMADRGFQIREELMLQVLQTHCASRCSCEGTNDIC